MSSKGQHTFTEIMSQPVVWGEVISSFQSDQARILQSWKKLVPREVLFIGCGSTHYLSQSAAAIFQGLTAVPSRACPSSELLFFPDQVLSNPAETLLVAISRSGITTETIQAVNRFKAVGGRAAWTITCYPENELSKISDLTLAAEAAQEESVAQTRSFSSMLILAKALAATVAGIDIAPLTTLPSTLERLLEDKGALFASLGRRLDLLQIFFLGSGPQFGIASEAMLKMTEMSITSSEAYHFMEFRHGPMSMVNEQTMVVGLIGQQTRAHEEKVLLEMGTLGAETVGLNSLSNACCRYQVGFDPAMGSWILPALYLPLLQLMAYYRAIAKGLDPDNPRNLVSVISLDPESFTTA